MKPEELRSCRTKCELADRLAAINPAKVRAYKDFRTVSSRNPRTRFYYDYSLWNRTRGGPPFEPDPPPARDFRWPPKHAGESIGYSQSLKWEERGFHLVAHVVEDDHVDNSHLGELWSNDRRTTYPPSSIKGDPVGVDYYKYDGEWVPRYWFVPQTDVEGERKAHRGDKPRHEAWLRAQNIFRWDWTRLERYGNDWNNVGVEVKAYRHGVELGEASVWGIESDADDYLVETAHDLASEAIAEAEKRLEELRATRAESAGAVLKTYKVKDYDTITTLGGGDIVFGSNPTYVTGLNVGEREVDIIVVEDENPAFFTQITREQWDELVRFVTAPYEPESKEDP